MVKKNFVAAKLTGDDPPTAAENLKLLLTLNADAKREALHGSKRIVNVSNWPIATNDNDRPAQGLGGRRPRGDWTTLLLLLEKVRDVDAPPAVITNDLVSPAIVGEPHPAFGAIGSGKADWVWLIALGLDLPPDKGPIGGGGCC